MIFLVQSLYLFDVTVMQGWKQRRESRQRDAPHAVQSREDQRVISESKI